MKRLVGLLVFVLLAAFADAALAQSFPKISIGVEQANQTGDISLTLQIVLMLTVLTLAPSILIMMTCFTRMIVVLSFLRQAMSAQQIPPNPILIGLSLFLTLFVMMPVWNQVNDTALQPYLKGDLSSTLAYERGIEPIREFMFKNTREKDLELFVHLSEQKKPSSPADIPTRALIPAFVISELRMAFQMGFILYIPFLIIDLVVASVLMSMGMMMLPPITISLPFKILLFVLVDGWHLIVESLVTGFK
jgi:flagellar biosynthetic protein FliP